MNTPWKIIYGYTYNERTNAQAIYDNLIESALIYKFKNLQALAVKVDGRMITESIFGLDSHSLISIVNGNQKLNGQKLKELFITTIFLKRLESKFKHGDNFFVVLPEEETSCDTAVIIAQTGSKMMPLHETQLKISDEHIPFEFQIKEYMDYARLKEDKFKTPQTVDKNKINKIAGTYKESTIIFMRDFLEYHSEDLNDFFSQHPNCYLISATNEVKVNGKQIELDLDKHNYVITYPQNTMSIESFERPKFLLNDEQLSRFFKVS